MQVFYKCWNEGKNILPARLPAHLPAHLPYGAVMRERMNPLNGWMEEVFLEEHLNEYGREGIDFLSLP